MQASLIFIWFWLFIRIRDKPSNLQRHTRQTEYSFSYFLCYLRVVGLIKCLEIMKDFQKSFFWSWIHDFISPVLKTMRVSFQKFNHWPYVCFQEKNCESLFHLSKSNFHQTFIVFQSVCRLLKNWLDTIISNFSLLKHFLQH